MLDWLEAIQTSPIKTSFTSITFFPRTVSLKGPPACIAGSDTSQRPSAVAAVSRFMEQCDGNVLFRIRPAPHGKIFAGRYPKAPELVPSEEQRYGSSECGCEILGAGGASPFWNAPPSFNRFLHEGRTRVNDDLLTRNGNLSTGSA